MGPSHMKDSMLLQDRVALVTGASRGIGRAIALVLAREGARVAVNYRSGRDLAVAVTTEIQSAGGQAVAIQADVRQRPEVDAMVEGATRLWGHVDILVNNAGIARDTLLLRMSQEDWDDVLETNLRGAFFCCRAVMRQMVRQRWGRIVNISSVIGRLGNAGQANYSASKAGLHGLTKSLAREYGGRNITVNAVAPGYIPTDMTATLPEGALEAILRQIPLGRLGTCQEVAEVVAFLASERAAYVTGQIIGVDGGML